MVQLMYNVVLFQCHDGKDGGWVKMYVFTMAKPYTHDKLCCIQLYIAFVCLFEFVNDFTSFVTVFAVFVIGFELNTKWCQCKGCIDDFDVVDLVAGCS